MSSAKGQKVAQYNNKSEERTTALPIAVVTAIKLNKGFVTKYLKKTTGTCPLSHATINDIINSRCPTARRGIQKACRVATQNCLTVYRYRVAWCC